MFGKLGFFFAFCIILELSIFPEHSTSIRGLFTFIKCTRFKSRKPQNNTSTLNRAKLGRTSRGTGYTIGSCVLP